MSSDHQLFSRAMRMAEPGSHPAPGGTRSSGARRRMEALVFVNLGPLNEALPTNARKEGPAFQAMKRLAIDQKLNVVFKLAGIDGWLRATAKVVWLSHSGTAGGLQLTDMPGESRRVVDLWFSTREQAARETVLTGSQTPPPGVTAPAGSMDLGLDSYQVVLPVEAIEIAPGPAQRGQRLAHVVVRATAQAAAPAIETNVGKGVAVPQILGPVKVPEPAKVLTPGKIFKVERSTAKSFALVMGVLLTIFFVGGVIVAELRSGPRTRSADAGLVSQQTPSAPATVPLPPADAAPAEPALPPSKSAIAPEAAVAAPAETTAPVVRGTAKVTKPASLAAASAPVRAASRPATAPVGTPQTVPARAPSAPSLTKQSTPPAPIPAAAPPAAAVTATSSAPANPIPERPAQPAAPATIAEKSSLAAAASPVNPEVPTGSIEVIADPYPSIRAPSQTQPRGSRPAALSIGRLISKVEPVYPPEALRQRITGTVKLHVVRGLDGRVETANVTDGPEQLRSAALQAVQQWRYEPTLLGSTPVQAEEDVAIVFRVTASSRPAN